MGNQELRQQYENYCKELKQKITDLQLENERLQRENEQWKTYKEPKRDLLKQIAMLKDGFEYQKDSADTYAKVLREIYDFLENKIDDVENGNFIRASELKKLKNSIPETALKRGE